MNNKQFALLVVGILCVCSMAFASVFQDKPMRKLSNGTYVVNTTTLAPNVKGFRGATPLEVHIKNNKIETSAKPTILSILTYTLLEE